MSALYWLRQDLRFHDNAALSAFCQKPSGLAVWCPTASFLRAGPRRRDFVLGCVLQFKMQYEALGGQFWLSDKPAGEALTKLLRQGHFTEVYFTSECTSEEQAEEREVTKAPGVQAHAFYQSSLLSPEDLPFAVVDLPKHFTVFRERVEKRLKIREPLAPPLCVPASPHHPPPPETFGTKNLIPHPRFTAGEDAAHARLQSYIWDNDCLKNYKLTRDGLLEWNDSSKLSPWLAVGALSPREVYEDIRRYEQERIKNESTYWLFFELLWRDFFRFNAERLGSALFTKVGELDRDPLRFKAWCEGKTGQSFIDAHMRELNETGWMSGRGRQNVASFLAKTWKLDWRLGAAYFEKQLIDYDAASNWGNWAYLAGVGQDPRNRALDAEWQAARYDADGSYRRRWQP